MGTLFTWGVTALGSSMIFFCKGYKVTHFLKVLQGFNQLLFLFSVLI